MVPQVYFTDILVKYIKIPFYLVIACFRSLIDCIANLHTIEIGIVLQKKIVGTSLQTLLIFNTITY